MKEAYVAFSVYYMVRWAVIRVRLRVLRRTTSLMDFTSNPIHRLLQRPWRLLADIEAPPSMIFEPGFDESNFISIPLLL